MNFFGGRFPSLDFVFVSSPAPRPHHFSNSPSPIEPNNVRKNCNVVYLWYPHYDNIRGTQRLLSVKYLSEKQVLPRIFYYLWKAKNF